MLLGYYILPSHIDQPIESTINPMGLPVRSKRRVWNTGDGRLKFIIIRWVSLPAASWPLPRLRYSVLPPPPSLPHNCCVPQQRAGVPQGPSARASSSQGAAQPLMICIGILI